MSIVEPSVVRAISLSCLIAITVGADTYISAQEGYPAATTEEARAVMDLSEKPLIEPAAKIYATIVSQHFETTGDVKDIGEKLDSELTKRGLKQQPNPFFSPDIVMATYEKSGFYFNLSVSPLERGKTALVVLNNLGNVDFRKLPKLANCRELYVGGVSALYSSDLQPAEATSQSRELLNADGWEWFGDTEVSFFMRKNAVKLQVMVSDSVQSDSKSTLSFSTELISTPLPLLNGMTRISYDEPQLTLRGDKPIQLDQLFIEYQKLLEPAGWKATTPYPLESRRGKYLIFQNSAGEVAELNATEYEGSSRFQLEFKTAARVKQQNELAKRQAEMDKAAMEAAAARKANPTTIEVAPPEGAKLKKQGDLILEFTVAPGNAQATVKQWLQQREAEGWKIETKRDSKASSDFYLTKEDAVLSISHFDSSVFDGDLKIETRDGFRLKLKK